MKTPKDLLMEHPFVKGLDPEFIDLMAGCAKNMVFKAGQYIHREGREADYFYLIRDGRAQVEIATPEGTPITIQTVGSGEMLGWSWLVPPYEWRFDARAAESTRVIALKCDCLRKKCSTDPRLGYEVLRRLIQVVAGRLEASRLQLVDLFGTRKEKP